METTVENVRAKPEKPAKEPNAECVSCGKPLSIPPEIIETEPEGFNCSSCYWVGPGR